MSPPENFQTKAINWAKTPLLFPLSALLAGIGLNVHLGYPVHPLTVPTGLACVAVALLAYTLRSRFFRLRYVALIATFVAIAAAGFQHSGQCFAPNEANFFAKLADEQSIVGAHVLRIKPGERSVRLEVAVERIYKDSTQATANGKLLVYLPPDIKTASVRPGDRIAVLGRVDTLRAPRNPGTFDAKAYWATQGIYHRIYLNDAAKWRHTRVRGRTVLRRAASLRRAWFKSFSHYLAGDELAVASALVLGQKDLLTTDVRSAYADTGAMHVLAVSGLHVGIIFLIISGFLRLLPAGKSRVVRVAKVPVTILLIWLFALVSGGSPSVQRAAIMFSVVALGRLALRRSYLLNTLAAAALIMLCLDPGNLLQIGFQLSFLALIGIVCFATPLQRLVPGEFPVWKQVKGGVAASVGAQLGTLPVGLYVFRSFPLYFMLSGSAVVIFAYVALCIGVAHGLLFAPFGENVLTDLTGWLLGRTVELQNAFIYFFSRLPNGVLTFPDWPAVSSLVIVTGLVFLAIGVNYRRWWSVFLGVLLIVGAGVFARSQEQSHGGTARTLTVYHLSRQSLIDYHSATETIVIGDEVEEATLDFQVRPNRERLGYAAGERTDIATLDSFQLGDQVWRVLDKEQERESILLPANTDVVLIRNGFSPNQLSTDQLPPDLQVIVDGSSPYYRYAEWRAFAVKHGVAVWLTQSQGAYVRHW